MPIRITAWVLFALAAAGAQPLSLWYRQPASQWVEALPVGNGRLGGMVFGGIALERVQFNENTVWTGEPHDYSHPGAYKYLGPIRELLLAGKQKEAEDLATREFMSVPLHQKAYQAFGDILLDFPDVQEREVTGYRRQLDLDNAAATVEYVWRGVTYRREVFASWPAQVLVIRLTAGKPGSLSFEAGLKSAHAGSAVQPAGDGELSMTGAVADSAIRFEARLLVNIEGGRRQSRGGRIAVTGANSATIVLSGATNFKNYKDVSADPKQRNHAYLAAVRSQSYDALKAAHRADHQRLFRRVKMDLGSSAASELPTDERIKRFSTGGDPQLVALLVQFGRYLMIASSREGGQPANLQGIWNDSNKPPWDSKYTCNINTEMNYWLAESANLGECHLALFNALKDLSVAGAVTAQEHYNARGWVVHHNFDLWRGTAPINASNHGIWQTGGAWMALHLWEHYLFTGDKDFLRISGYPLMRGAALFFVDTLVKDPQHGWLITGPSNSPEQGGLVMGPTMDCQIVRGLFGAVIAASRILGVDEALRGQLTDMRGRIAPDQVGRHGQLQEWLEDQDDPQNHHRHVSHLWGVYPGSEITPYGSPELFAAARKSLEFRGDAATGWSMGWKVNLWARFLDGGHAYRILENLIKPAGAHQAGLYPNLFDAHPPFQIDGNFGTPAGIVEMLLQSQDPYGAPASLTPVESGQAAFVHLLPALPSAFPNGSVSGLKARGAIEIGIAWRNGKLAHATLRSEKSKAVRVRYAGKEREIDLDGGHVYELQPDLFQ
jgi:alpha-L-fucosidase 2